MKISTIVFTQTIVLVSELTPWRQFVKFSHLGSTHSYAKVHDTIYPVHYFKSLNCLFAIFNIYDNNNTQIQIKTFYELKIVTIFLPINLNMCFGCSKEQSNWDGSFEYPQHMFWMRNKENSFPIHTLIWRPDNNNNKMWFRKLNWISLIQWTWDLSLLIQKRKTK